MTSNTGSSALTLTPVNGEPRVHDLALAEKLGFADRYMIRKLIKRNEAKLLKFGVVSTVETTTGALGGRPTAEFYLNQKQAIFVCMKSETEKAFDVQADIVRVFDAYLSGEVRTNIPMVRDPKIRDLACCVRAFSASRDLWSKQMMLYAIKRLCGEMNMPMPPSYLLGKPVEQYQLEV
jgi:hypothetical protein